MLTSFPALRKHLRREDGAALPMVLLVFVLSVAIVGAFLVSIVGSSQVTNSAKESVRTQAAAEAGIAMATAVLADPCATVSTVSETLDVGLSTRVVSVEYGDGTTWGGDCVGSDHLRIVAEGSLGAGTEVATVETIFGYTPPVPVSETGGTALRTAGGLVLTGNAHITTVDENYPADVYVENGNMSCGGSGRIEGSVYVANGTARLTGSCPIIGDLVVSGDVHIEQGSEIRGDVVSVTGSVYISGGVTVYGDVFAKQNLNRSNGKVTGSAYIGNNATFSGGAPAINGTLHYGGTVSFAWGSASSWVLGGAPQKHDTSAVPRPTIPEEPPFVDVTLSNIVSNGYTQVPWSGSCAVKGGTPHAFFSTTIPGFTVPTVVNAMSCNPLSTASGVDLSIRTDLVIIAPKISLNNVRIKSADGNPHKIWFVVPTDSGCSVDGQPEIGVEGSVKFPDGKITALAYTACEVYFQNGGNDPWPGSVYARVFTGYAAIDYIPIGLPVAVTSGGGSGTPGSMTPGILDPDPVSQRNLG